jgi:hypothetical protein
MRFVRVDDHCLVWTAVDGERGTTRVREAVVTSQLFEAGLLAIDSYQRSWAQDPYDADYARVDGRLLRYMSDDEQYDAQFPQHPRSHGRHLLKKRLTEASLDGD